MQPILKAEGLCKYYELDGRRSKLFPAPRTSNDPAALDLLAPGPKPNSIWALKDISFSIKAGEIVGILGRNGAGKSTLLRILSRVTAPTAGRGVIRGRVSLLSRLGTGFHPELSGRENVYLNGTILGMRKREIDRRFDQIVEFSGVERFLDVAMKRYSSGMSVRLAFSIAVHLETDILLIDEVLSAGDVLFQKKSLDKIQSMPAQGRTVLLVTHNVAVVENLCTRAIFLRAGKIYKDGPPHESLLEYKASIEAAV